MLPNSLPRKLIQITEEALDPVHLPLFVGHDLFIFSQQDVRKLEDTRVFCFSKIMPNGDIRPINIQEPHNWLMELLRQENLVSNPNFRQLLEAFYSQKRMSQEQQRTQNQLLPYLTCVTQSSSIQPMDVSSTACQNSTVASIEQQLQWDKCLSTSALFPMNYSRGTSMTGISYKTTCDKEPPKKPTCCCCCVKCQNCQSTKLMCNRSSHTEEISNEIRQDPEIQNQTSPKMLSAREQLKMKKLRYCL